MSVDTPTADDLAGTVWWNSMSERQRLYWLQVAKTNTPRHAWDYYKLCREVEGAQS